MASYWFEAHTGEVRVALRARDLTGLFVAAGHALAELMGGEAGRSGGDLGQPVSVRTQAPDREALLVAWLDDLIYLSEMHKRVWTRLTITRLTDGTLEATVRGPRVEQLRTAVKAATLHGLKITEADGALSASVVLDV